MINDNLKAQSCSTPEMVKYSLGACTESLILNSFFGFAMLYYTKALGLSPEYAGWAAFVATIWDAGYVSGPNATQHPDVIWRICALPLVVGPLASLMALALILKYPVSKAFIENMRSELTP